MTRFRRRQQRRTALQITVLIATVIAFGVLQVWLAASGHRPFGF